MNASDYSDRYCIIGAGACGLGVVKVFQDRGIPCDCLEREDDVGGVWYFGKQGSAICRSTHLITSKAMSAYRDYPMPASYSQYPSHQEVWEYLRSYARAFDLYRHISLNTSVEAVEPLPGEFWQVTLTNGEVRRYRGVVIANGHLWSPNVPQIDGHFAGETLHSSRYKTEEVLRDRRVIVVGNGNSACDIATDAARSAKQTWMSVRSGCHFMPKFLFGEPTDVSGDWLHRWSVPLWIQRGLAHFPVLAAVGRPQDYGFPKPDHPMFHERPIMNTHILTLLGHGRIKLKPAIQAFEGSQVRFADGTAETADIVIFATGFRVRIPFLDEEHLEWDRGRPRLWLNAFHPRYDHLYFSGLCEPSTLTWAAAEEHAEVMASFIQALARNGRSAEWFRQQKARAPFAPTDGKYPLRDFLEVEYHRFVRQLRRVNHKLAA